MTDRCSISGNES